MSRMIVIFYFLCVRCHILQWGHKYVTSITFSLLYNFLIAKFAAKFEYAVFLSHILYLSLCPILSNLIWPFSVLKNAVFILFLHENCAALNVTEKTGICIKRSPCLCSFNIISLQIVHNQHVQVPHMLQPLNHFSLVNFIHNVNGVNRLILKNFGIFEHIIRMNTFYRMSRTKVEFHLSGQ